MKIVSTISRILAGLIFMFSGFVKGVDPMGSAIKFQEYFDAMGMSFLTEFSFPVSIMLIALEFIAGFSLFFNLKIRYGAWCSLLLMIFFLPLTLWLAVTDKVSDCGCFGDAIKLTNLETFYKNVIIMIPVVIVFLRRNKIRPLLTCRVQWIASFAGLLVISFFIWYSLAHLPFIDFLPYKKGANLAELMKVPEGYPKDEYEQFIKLKDTVANKEIEITVTEYSNDSTYWGEGTKYRYISISEARLVKKGYTPLIHDFTITTSEGENLIDSVLGFDGYSFVFVSPKLEKANIGNMALFNNLAVFSQQNNFIFLGITSSLKSTVDSFAVKHKLVFPVHSCDETTLKTIIRSNPGLLLLKKGVVVDKWHYNDVPDVEEFIKIYQTCENK